MPFKREVFARLAKGQSPDALWITCSDSRVAPNWFVSNDPGDLFVVRNIGNLVPPATDNGAADQSVAAAIEFAILSLGVKDIIVCGHSECGAMHALADGSYARQAPHLRKWLGFGEASLEAKPAVVLDGALNRCNGLSQVNVLQQIEHLNTYSIVRERVENGAIRVHAWWFNIAEGSLYAYEAGSKRFVLIDEDHGQELLETFKGHC